MAISNRILEIITPELSPGETIEWMGMPNASVVFHEEDALLIPFTLLVGAFAIFWSLGVSGLWHGKPNQGFEWFGIILGTPFVLFTQYQTWGRFFYAYWEKKRTYYSLTNRRALVIRQGLTGRSTSSAYFVNLTVVDKRTRADGIGSISFGGPVTSRFQFVKRNAPRPLTFDDIDDADTVYRTVFRVYERGRKNVI